MRAWRVLSHKLRRLVRRPQLDEQLRDELQFHIESRVDELERSGYARDAARARATAEFGSTARVMEDTRAAWRFMLVEECIGDTFYALRAFRRRPAFTITAIGCLAVGIGANALIFSLVNAAFLRPLPYPDGDRLAMVRFTPPAEPDQKLGTNAGGYFFIREHSRSFERLGVLRVTGFSVAAGDPEDSTREWLQGGWASPGLTDVFGVPPLLGRWFGPDDDVTTIDAAVISYGMWQRSFGGRTDVLGQTIYLDLWKARVIGVAPPGYQTLTPDVDLWIQQTDQNLAGALRSPNRLFNIAGRLRPGVTVAQAQAELRSLEEPLGSEYPMHRGWGLAVDSLREASVGYLRQPILVLQGAVLLLLLIACANVAGLLLAQALVRQRELGVRAALGSTRARILRQLLTEHLLLSLGACAVGIGIAWIGLQMLVNTAFSAYGVLQNVTLDWHVTAFAVLVSLLTAMLFGILPAWQLSRSDVIESVRGSGRTTAGPTMSRIRSGFVVAQIALAVALLVATGLLARTLLRLNGVDLGMRPDRLLAIQIPMPRMLYRNTGGNTPAGGLLVQFDGKFSDLTERLRTRFQSTPGVEAVAATTPAPLGGRPRRVMFQRDSSRDLSDDRDPWTAEWYAVSPRFFDTVQISLLRGRTFTEFDAGSMGPVVIINESLATRYWPNDNPIGQQLQTDVLDDPPREIIGIVGDVRQDRYQSAPVPQVYVPRAQLPHRMDMQMALEILVTTFVVRASGDPGALVPSLRAAAHDVEPTLSVSSARTVEDYAAAQLRELREYAAVLGVFGTIAVTLAVIGILGVMAQAVRQRSNEIAIRLALGANRADVLGLVLGQGALLTGAGVALGLCLSLLFTPVIRSFLWGVTTNDPVTILVVAAGLGIVALVACYVPARRALKVAPVTALRAE